MENSGTTFVCPPACRTSLYGMDFDFSSRCVPEF